jgi:hypothetical protein
LGVGCWALGVHFFSISAFSISLQFSAFQLFSSALPVGRVTEMNYYL